MCHCDSHPVLIFEGALNVALTKKAIKALVPQNTVPEKAVLLAIARLSSTTFVRSAQVLFLKWLVLVFPMFDSTSVLRPIPTCSDAAVNVSTALIASSFVGAPDEVAWWCRSGREEKRRVIGGEEENVKYKGSGVADYIFREK